MNWNPFKKKNPWVRFYSTHPGVAELYPWLPASKIERKWRRDALKQEGNRTTKCPAEKLRRLWEHQSALLNGREDGLDGMWNHAVTCPALTQLMDTGWVLQCPADILIHMDGEGDTFEWISQLQFDVGGPTYVKGHIEEQTRGMRELVTPGRPVMKQTIKLELPWRVMAHPDLIFIQIPLPYYDEDRYSIPMGIVDPQITFEVNIQLFWHALDNGEYMIKAGTPFCQWIPMSRKLLQRGAYDVIIEDANQHDLDNNKIMDYNRYNKFTETTTLKDRIEYQAQVLKLNKNNERFN